MAAAGAGGPAYRPAARAGRPPRARPAARRPGRTGSGCRLGAPATGRERARARLWKRRSAAPERRGSRFGTGGRSAPGRPGRLRSSAMIVRIEARISSIDGSCARWALPQRLVLAIARARVDRARPHRFGHIAVPREPRALANRTGRGRGLLANHRTKRSRRTPRRASARSRGRRGRPRLFAVRRPHAEPLALDLVEVDATDRIRRPPAPGSAR